MVWSAYFCACRFDPCSCHSQVALAENQSLSKIMVWLSCDWYSTEITYWTQFRGYSMSDRLTGCLKVRGQRVIRNEYPISCNSIIMQLYFYLLNSLRFPGFLVSNWLQNFWIIRSTSELLFIIMSYFLYIS